MRDGRGFRADGPGWAAAPFSDGDDPEGRRPLRGQSGLQGRSVEPNRAAALARLKERVDRFERHRSGTDPATMPLFRPGRQPLGDDRGFHHIETADENESGFDIDRAMEVSVDAGLDVPVQVSVLGNVEIHGLGHLTPQQQALVCFLALHPGAGREAIVEALWDGRSISESRFLNLIAETRAVVGPRRLPPASNGRYSVAGLTVDAELLIEAGQRADQARRSNNTHQERSWLRRGLVLISGPLLRPPGRRYWTWLDDAYDVAAGLESTIIAQSIRLAELALASDDTQALDVETAAWAYRRCLLAVPHHDEAARALAALYRGSGRHSAARLLERSRRRSD